MSNWKEKISLRNLSSANIAALCWCGTILAGNLPIAMKTGNYIDLPFNCAFLAVLFLIQLATAVILGNCYDKTEPSLHRKILIALGVLHGILMLGDMSLLLWLGSFWGGLYIVNNAFSAHRNIFNVFAEEMARYCCCVIQLDRMDSAGLLFRSSAVRNKNEILSLIQAGVPCVRQ